MFFDWFHDSPHMSFEDAHWVVWDNYPHDFERFWGLKDDTCPEHLNADDWDEFRRLYDLAQRLGDGVIRLVRPKRIPDRALSGLGELRRAADDVERMVRDIVQKAREAGKTDVADLIEDVFLEGPTAGALAHDAFFRNAMQIVAFHRFDYDLSGYADRMIQLIGHLTRAKDNRTQAYLARVAECYIRGMDPEFAVMARAVMHSAIERVLPEEAARGLVREGGKGRLGLAAHIDAAVAAGMVPDEVRRAMLRIKEAGDDAVHELPQLAPRPAELIERLSVVLKHLEEYPNAA
jgi:hypothetical protein